MVTSIHCTAIHVYYGSEFKRKTMNKELHFEVFIYYLNLVFIKWLINQWLEIKSNKKFIASKQ